MHSTSFCTEKKKETANHLEKTSINALKWRSVGPALHGKSIRYSSKSNNPLNIMLQLHQEEFGRLLIGD